MSEIQRDTRRPEALALPWDEMSASQQTAAEKVAELLLDAVAHVDAENERRRKETLRPGAPRYSQLAFINGDRGMGKTSLLLSLIYLAGFKISARADSELSESELPESIRQLRAAQDRLIWLDTLDMEPIAKHSDLFVAILVRLQKVLEQDSSVTSAFDDRRLSFEAPMPKAKDSVLFLTDEGPYEKTLRNFDDLITDAVLHWKGPEPARSGRIEPTMLSVETRRAEEAGLMLHSRMAHLLDQLARIVESTHRTKRDPIFVVPVDDFDLAPARCLELLRLIRTIAPARLFFVMVGNIRIAEEVLRLQTEGELARVAGGQPTEAIWGQRLSPVAQEIAANNIRKLLPPSQRADLLGLSTSKALSLRLPDGERTLCDVLAAIHFQRNAARVWEQTISLESFLFIGGANKDPDAYSGASWLGGTPRQVQDLALALNRHRGEQSDWGESLLETLREILYREAREDWRFISMQARKLLVDLFAPFGPKRLDFRDTVRLEVKRSFDREARFEYGSVALFQKRRLELWLRQRIEPILGQEREHEEEHIDIPPRLAAGVLFFHDLAISLWGGNIPTGSLMQEAEPGLTLVRWGHSRISNQFRQRGPIAVRWQLPLWWATRDYEGFTRRWKAYSDWKLSRESEEKVLARRASAWLLAMLETVLDEDGLTTHSPREDTVYKRIAIALAKLVNEEHTPGTTTVARRELRRGALIAFLKTLAPECAVPISVIEGIEKNGKESLWTLLESAFGAGDALEKDKPAHEGESLILEIQDYRAQLARQARQRELGDPSTVALFAAIVPGEAEAWCRGRLSNLIDQAKKVGAPDSEETMANFVIGSLGALETSVNLGHSNASILKQLDSFEEESQSWQGPQLAVYANTMALLSFLPIARAALSDAYRNHPINTFLGGALIPKASDL